MAAVVPVVAGINLEYYFCYVDPTGYGCGTKLPHNVTSLLGVMDGAQSDLRTGLPWQMVEIHEPTRLAIVVEGTRDRVLRVVEANPSIERLVRNRWVWLACLDAGLRHVVGAPLDRLRRAHARTCAGSRHGRIGRVVPGQARVPSSGGDRPGHRSITQRGAQLDVTCRAFPSQCWFWSASDRRLSCSRCSAALARQPPAARAVDGSARRRLDDDLRAPLCSSPLVVYGMTGTGTQLLSYGAWSAAHEGGIAIEFLVDRLSLAFAALSTAIAGVVSAFSNRYLHREPGYNRYFVLLAMFVTGMLLVALAGNVAVLFIGWEFVGLSSALLVAFFHERPAAVSNAFRVLSVYRISDAAMLSAAVLLRHVAGTDSLSLLFGGARASTTRLTAPMRHSSPSSLSWPSRARARCCRSRAGCRGRWRDPHLRAPSTTDRSRSTPGVFCCCARRRCSNRRPRPALLAGGLGAATALFAGITTRVQSDVKSSLAYASLTQVGIIVVEIAIGWYTIAFVHLAGHACFRLLQFLSAPNVLHDLHGLEEAIGDRASPAGGHFERSGSDRARQQLFLIALERGFLDNFLDRVVVEPFTRLARRLTRLDEWLCDAVLPARGRQPSTKGSG